VLKIFIYDEDRTVIAGISAALFNYPFVESVKSATHPSEALARLRRIQCDLVFWGFHKNIKLERQRRDQVLKDQSFRPVVNLVDLNRGDLVENIFNPLSLAVGLRTDLSEGYQLFFDAIFYSLPTLVPDQLVLNQPKFSHRQLMFFQEVALGYENLEICQRLGVSYETVRSNLKALSRQMKSRSREHLVAAGFRNKVLH
jgi:DNA-binding NarL/FixJ family response regulator